MRQQRGADAAGAAPQDDAGVTGPEAAVLEPASVPDRPPQGSDAVWPAGVESARLELLGIPQADAGGIAGKTGSSGSCARSPTTYQCRLIRLIRISSRGSPGSSA